MGQHEAGSVFQTIRVLLAGGPLDGCIYDVPARWEYTHEAGRALQPMPIYGTGGKYLPTGREQAGMGLFEWVPAPDELIIDRDDERRRYELLLARYDALVGRLQDARIRYAHAMKYDDPDEADRAWRDAIRVEWEAIRAASDSVASVPPVGRP